MARYPTFEEYRKRGNFHEGIKRCEDLLKKSPNDVQLLTVKVQLLYATGGDANAVLQQLSSLQPPILDLGEIAAIEDAVENSQRDVYPQPNTAGPTVASIWDNAVKASRSLNHKLDLLSLRFSRAIVDNRLLDSQQALIQLKALQPKSRVIYMAHLAITQLLSTSKEDLQSRLALSLARKAVKENFDEEKSLDCRVVGQIFAHQASEPDLESIVTRSFAECKQVYDARKAKPINANGDAALRPESDPASVAPAEWLSSESQSLKQQFAELVRTLAPLSAITAFAANSIRLFHTVKTNIPDPRGRGLADACFLSVSALVRMFELSHESRSLLHAAFLLETLLQHSPYVHEARLLLVYLYMNLGLGSLAMRMFDSLNVKEIQHDTVGHVLFARLSTTHPHRTRTNKKDLYDPQKRLTHALGVYTRHEEKLAESAASVLNHEQTGMLFDLQELRLRLSSSLTRRVIHLEQRRVSRNLENAPGYAATELGSRMAANWLNTTDNRDFAATFNFGYNVERILHDCGQSSRGALWISHCLAADSAWCIAQGLEPPVRDPEALLVENNCSIEDKVEQLKIDDDQSTPIGLTASEAFAGRLACQLLKLLLHLNGQIPGTKDDIATVLKSVQSLDLDKLRSDKVVLTEGLNDSYVYLDILRIVVQACKHAKSRVSEGQTELQDLQVLAESHCSVLLQHAREGIKRVDVAKIKAHMEQDVMVQDTVKLLGNPSMEEFCRTIASAAKEGWEGLTMITIG